MKTLQWAVALLVLGVLSLPGCTDRSVSPVSPADQIVPDQGSLGKVTTVPFTSTDYPLEVLDPGKVAVVDGNLVMKNVVVRERMNSDNPMANGTMIHSLSLVINLATGEGPCRGTFTLTPDADMDGGVWEGTYSGYRTKIGDQVFRLPLTTIGLGRGGTLEGLKMNGTMVLTVYGTPPTFWTGVGEGYITMHYFGPSQAVHGAVEK